MPNVKKNLIGQKIGKLTLLNPTNKRKRKSVVWKAYCECGNITEISVETFYKEKKKSCGCYKKNKEIEAPLNALFDRYKYQAKYRNYEFSLGIEQFKNITSQNCEYCNINPIQRSKSKKGKSYFYNGIDRKNNDLGYTINNCVPCCKICNDIKGQNLTYEEMKIAMKAVINYRGEK